ncbi:hypothetical protein H6G80_09025 [Nostoc sp. FACHB-87]|uniref:hypothetical protein n=1 Tax=Nostocales TaxID=1161 RepID=UPI001686E342|nr:MULTISPECIES: hypothetical protein [Nostocales]MBD2298259.1 hypothetical protein [Nostoc sp. FACHB-190]MBD2454220.1 hypothetical protein [Nostoc sp. FACHB-87]MBD2474189.1 hypothetical protein [Anabaena sp. FACHB-83]MBD2488789.1 hypothetical protein [Aulosira sp. FACHB-615]
MSSDIQTQKPELFLDISEQQQEIISGGRSRYSGLSIYNLFFQKTDIETFANSAITISGSNGGISSVQQTGYKFSQITLGLSLGGRRSRRISKKSLGLLDILFSLISSFD